MKRLRSDERDNMPKLVAMVRVKDGINYIELWLENMSELVDEIVAVDNGSSDGTYEILQRHPKVVAVERTEGFDEGRDKILLYRIARECDPDWLLWLDVDEVFEKRMTRKKLDRMMSSKFITRYSFRRFHLFGDKHHFMASVPMLWDISWPTRDLWKEQPTAYFADLKIHNGPVRGVKGFFHFSTIRILHWGFLYPDDMKKKTRSYIKLDPDRQEMYEKHRDMEPSTWPLCGFTERPFLYVAQETLLWFLVMVRIVKIIAKKCFRKLK